MTEPIRVDALASDDRLLDLLATRRYDGTDPVGSMLLSFAHACDNPSPAVRPRSLRRSGGRVALSTFATTALLVSGAGVAAAVTDRLPDGVAQWTAGIHDWWSGLPGISGQHGAANEVLADGSGPSGVKTAQAAPAATAAKASTAAVVHAPSGEAAIPVVPTGSAASSTEHPLLAIPSASTPAEATPGPTTPTVIDQDAPGKSGSAPGRTVAPPDRTGGSPNTPTDPRPSSGRNIPPAVLPVIDAAPPAVR